MAAKATKLSIAAGHCRYEGRCKQAARLNVDSARAAAHAASLRRCGWTTYRRPLAPNVDGTRNVVWQSHARRRVFDIFALLYWALQVRMVGVREQARLDAERKKPGSAGTSDRIGERIVQMRLWRAIRPQSTLPPGREHGQIGSGSTLSSGSWLPDVSQERST